MDDGYPRSHAVALDAADPLAGFREEFLADGEPGLIYLDGNSLGRLPAATPAFLDQVVRDGWGRGLVRSWETWIGWGRDLGDRIGTRLLGARPGEVVLSDGTSVNLYKLAAAALDAAPRRRTILMDAEDFPTNRYIMQGLAEQRGLRLTALRSDLDDGLDPGVIRAALDADVALLVLSLVSYRSGALLDMAEVNAAASDAGTVVLWDLCHAVGAVPVDLAGGGAKLAVGCTYKYLNGGPGSPAFLYVSDELSSRLRQPIWGWYGQREQFAMGPRYDPVDDIDRFLVGTPPLLSLAAVGPALDIVERAGIGRLREKSIRLGQMVVELADRWLSSHGFRLASPRDPERRGSHVSLAHPRAWQICRALASEASVICDYRVPDRLRIAPAPLYTSYADTWDALDRLRDIAASRSYERQAATLARVT
jgi:kynureninase